MFIIYYVNRIESKHEVTILSGLNEFVVKFFGPPGCKKLSNFTCCDVRVLV